jgi:hypothetical protein
MLNSHLTHKKSVISNVLLIAKCPYSPIRMEYICLHTHLKWNRIISHIYSTNLEILELWHELFNVVQQYIHVHWLEKSALLFYRDKHALNMILLEDGCVISMYRLPSTWTIPWVVTQSNVCMKTSVGNELEAISHRQRTNGCTNTFIVLKYSNIYLIGCDMHVIFDTCWVGTLETYRGLLLSIFNNFQHHSTCCIQYFPP